MPDTDAASRRRVILLDYTGLMGDPGLLDLSHPDFSMWITPSTMKTIREGNDPMSVAVKNKLPEALQARRVNYNPVDFTDFSPLPDMYGPYADVLKHAATMKEGGDRVTLVTVDPTMSRGAQSLGVDVVDGDGLRSLMTAALEADRERKLEVEREERRQRKQVVVRSLMGLIIAFVSNVIWAYRAPIIELITVYGVLVVVAVTGIGLYALRGRFRLVYGVAEAAVGYFTAARIVFPNVDVYSIGLIEGIALLGGLYIIIRGLDNVGKGLEKTPYEALWRRYSGEAKA